MHHGSEGGQCIGRLSIRYSVNYLISTAQDRLRYHHTERSRRLQIHKQLELCWLFNRYILRFRAFHNTSDSVEHSFVRG